MSDKVEPIGVEQLLEIPPADDAWVNVPIIARVIAVETIPKKTSGNFWKVELGSDTSAARIFMSVFTPPKFARGALIEIGGSGNRVKEYRGNPELSLGKQVEIHVISTALPTARHNPPPPNRAPADDQRGGGPPAENPPAEQLPLPGTETAQLFPMQGQTVGMVMKEAVALIILAHPPTDAEIEDGKFYAKVWRVSSHLAKISAKLLRGDLAPFPGSTPKPAPAAEQSPPATSKPPAGSTPPPKSSTPPKRNTRPPAGQDEDVPF